MLFSLCAREEKLSHVCDWFSFTTANFLFAYGAEQKIAVRNFSLLIVSRKELALKHHFSKHQIFIMNVGECWIECMFAFLFVAIGMYTIFNRHLLLIMIFFCVFFFIFTLRVLFYCIYFSLVGFHLFFVNFVYLFGGIILYMAKESRKRNADKAKKQFHVV